MNVFDIWVNLILVIVINGEQLDINRRAVMTEMLPELFQLYKQGFHSDKPLTRRFLRNTTEYTLHVEKLKEVGGYKAHNLRIETKNIQRQHPTIFYINNPIEANLPHAYITEEEFKVAMLTNLDERNNLPPKQNTERHNYTPFTSKMTSKTTSKRLVSSKKTIFKTKPIQIKNIVKIDGRHDDPHGNIDKVSTTRKNNKTVTTQKYVTEIETTQVVENENTTEVTNKELISEIANQETTTVSIAPVKKTVTDATTTAFTKPGKPLVFMANEK